MSHKKLYDSLHGYGPPSLERWEPPQIPGVKIYYSKRIDPLDLNSGFTLLRVNGGYAVKQHYPDLKPGEVNFILR